ncbi:hypothetical protein PENTCL1PPCAC_29250, partial [Pristionchus entomophagus]
SDTYDLPSLHVSANQDFLTRGNPTVLTCRVLDGWRFRELSDVFWLRDGQPLEVGDHTEYVPGPDNTLTIQSLKHFMEGEFQCQGWILEVVLSNAQNVDANLISPPLKLRKARITKFEKTKEVTIYVRPGSVARLPCPGMPDVVPGPPEILFERENLNETLGSSAGNSRFLSSTSGMQIAMVQPSDAGKYFCIVRNDFTRQEKKSMTAVELKVVTNNDPENARMPPERMEVSWPEGRMSSAERPIQLEVVHNNNILIECVVKNARISWHRTNRTLNVGSAKDSRIRQVFGNLQIKDLQMNDAGIYVCKGQSLFNDKDEVLVYYEVIVHQPSDVVLHLTQATFDRSWEISCYAQNLRYEIPMVFVNSTPLIDAVERMGIPTVTNFYTNPINVTMMSRNNFSGTVQCISRPAMEEAEIYGIGLERGRSKNYYVLPDDERNTGAIVRGPTNMTVVEGETVELICKIKRVLLRLWKKESENIKLNDSRVKLLSSNSLRITNATVEDEGWYTCVVEDENREKFSETAYLSVVSLVAAKPTAFDALAPTDELKPKKKIPPAKITRVSGFVIGNDVRLQWTLEDSEAVPKIATFVVQSRMEGESKWSEATHSLGHTRSTLIMNLKPQKKFKFRVIAVNEDKTASAGTETDWMETMEPQRETRPAPPLITSVVPLSSQSVRILWRHEATHNLSQATQFVISYGKEDRIDSTIKVEGAAREWTVTGLSENATYSFSILAENPAGESDRSNIVTVKTMHPDEERRGLLSLLQRGLMDMLPGTEDQRVHVLLLLTFIPLLFLMICCVCCCRYRTLRRNKNGGANKFLDTSYNIYNQQKVHRSKLTEPYDPKEFFDHDNIEEHLPLRGNNLQNEDRVSLNSRSSRRFRLANGRFPNLYGGGEEESDEEQHDGVDHLAPLENHYGLMGGGGILSYNPIGTAASTARCYSADTGVSREILVPHPPNLLSNGGLPLYHPTCSTPLPHIPPLINTTCSPFKSATSVSYKTAGDAAVIAYSPASLAESGGSGSAQTRTTNADSPTHPLTDGSENGVGPRGDSSRNSQISSVDGRFQPLASSSFKSTVPPLMSTFAR